MHYSIENKLVCLRVLPSYTIMLLMLDIWAVRTYILLVFSVFEIVHIRASIGLCNKTFHFCKFKFDTIS